MFGIPVIGQADPTRETIMATDINNRRNTDAQPSATDIEGGDVSQGSVSRPGSGTPTGPQDTGQGVKADDIDPIESIGGE